MMNNSISNSEVNKGELNEANSSNRCEDHSILNKTDILKDDFFSNELLLEENRLREERQGEDEKIKVKDLDEEERKERYTNLLSLLENSTKLTDIFETRLQKCKLQIIEKELKHTNSLRENVSSSKEDPINITSDLSNEDDKQEYYLNLFKQPKLFEGQLKPHQIEGLLWIRTLFENGLNGILADDMGLGKTIQTIAFYCFLIEMGITGPFLVIAPLSTLPNWMTEFWQFSPQLSTLVYHGSREERIEMRSKLNQTYRVKDLDKDCYHIIITTYEVIRYDINFLKSIKWRFITIDEGHKLKNVNSNISQCLRQFGCTNKLILTGTPIQNDMTELWSLLNLLMPSLFSKVEDLNSWFVIDKFFDSNDKIASMAKKDEVLNIILKILKPFILRREKKETDLNIPPKKEIVVYAPITDEQQKLYKATLNKHMEILFNEKNKEDHIIHGERPKRKCVEVIARYTECNAIRKAQVQEPIEKKKIATSVVMQNPFMQLKKIANHPYLVHMPLVPGTKNVLVNENIVKVSGKFQVLDAMLTKLKQRGNQILLFSTMTQILDIIEEFLIFRTYKYTRLDGTMPLQSRIEAMKTFNTDPEYFIMIISTRAGGLGLNLTTADTVIIFDSDWNPQSDLQAQDRCHRMGQKKPVVVYRFCSKNTVDERILERASAKRKLEKIIISSGSFNNSNKKLTLTDFEALMNLLESSDYNKKIQSNGFIFTDEELDILLDRSDMVQSVPKESAAQPAEHFVILNNE